MGASPDPTLRGRESRLHGEAFSVVELFLGDMGSMQRELRPSIQREDQPTVETKLEQMAVKAVNRLPKSVVREIRTPRSVGAGGGRPPPATRWAAPRGSPYPDLWHVCDVPTDSEPVCLSGKPEVISARSE
jgi:hypothetical protein